MTELIYQALLKSHMIAGLLALPIFWIPALTKKGSPIHRRTGRWFLILMAFVAATGLPLALRFVAMDSGSFCWDGHTRVYQPGLAFFIPIRMYL